MKLVGVAKEMEDNYRVTVVTLAFNNKIVINNLTEISKENMKYAIVVVGVIEERPRKVESDKMLPLIYQIDSMQEPWRTIQ